MAAAAPSISFRPVAPFPKIGRRAAGGRVYYDEPFSPEQAVRMQEIYEKVKDSLHVAADHELILDIHPTTGKDSYVIKNAKGDVVEQGALPARALTLEVRQSVKQWREENLRKGKAPVTAGSIAEAPQGMVHDVQELKAIAVKDKVDRHKARCQAKLEDEQRVKKALAPNADSKQIDRKIKGLEAQIKKLNAVDWFAVEIALKRTDFRDPDPDRYFKRLQQTYGASANEYLHDIVCLSLEGSALVEYCKKHKLPVKDQSIEGQLVEMITHLTGKDTQLNEMFTDPNGPLGLTIDFS